MKNKIGKKLSRPNEINPVAEPAEPVGLIEKGDIVRLRASPGEVGAVIDILESSGETRFLVFHAGTTSTYYRSQLEIADKVLRRQSVSPSELHAALTALQLQHPSTNHLYSLFASRIQFVPYQFRPVLKLIKSERPRILIADEVGVGKTIESGLILKELQARSDIRSVLVICPKSLVGERKWQNELKRFDEEFVHLDGDTLRYCIEETHLDGIWPQQYAKAILPYSLFDEALLLGKQKGRRHQRGLLELDPPPAFDLVIVDEAHYIRNTDTWAYRTVRYFCDNAEAVVLLSATPVQLGSNDLFTLLHLLRPDILPARQEFEQMAEPNPYINTAIEIARKASLNWRQEVRTALEQALDTPWGRSVLRVNPRVKKAYELMEVDRNNEQARLSLIRLLEELYTFSTLINRTRRRDIGNFTTRKPATVTVEFTPEQAALHTDLLSLIARIMAYRHGDDNLKFMLTIIRRQLASCVFGLAPFLEAILHRHLSRIELSEAGVESFTGETDEVIGEFRSEVSEIIRSAKSIVGPDPKFDAFRKIILEKQKLSNNKLLVFSTFRHTLAYLESRIAEEPVRMGLIHGGISDEERRGLRNRFSLPKDDPQALDILLSSEVGCEGLDYQFCDALVNYDLPWNPMRVEQRIGRIDRYGQKSQSVLIYNLITPGTVDAEIYERCLLRIGVFQQALGGSEAILGKITREIRDIAENFELTADEQNARLQQIADNEIRIIQEQERLEEEQATFFGLNPPHSDDDMVKKASSYWLTPVMLANLIKCYLSSINVISLEKYSSQYPIKKLKISQEARNKLLVDFKKTGLTGRVAQEWERWLKGSDSSFSFTFEQSTASEQPEVIFITPIHPLVRQAAQSVALSESMDCNLSVVTNEVSPGRYPYAIYRWRKLGLKEDFEFQVIWTESNLTLHMLHFFESAKPDLSSFSITDDEEKELEAIHFQRWSHARRAHVKEIQEVSSSRLASLKGSHIARLDLLKEQRDSAGDVRIQRMRDSQIETANLDYNRRKSELNDASQRGDIIAEAVAFGILTVENKND